MPTTQVSCDVITDAVQHACRAPSVHNSQPWHWTAEGTRLIHLHLDCDRLVATDPAERQALISCGAALDHFRVAMAAQGWTANVDHYPNPNDATHLAAIDFSPMNYVTDAHRRRADAIMSRYTDRLPFAPPAGWSDFEPLLRQCVDEQTAFVDVLADDARPKLAHASQLSESLRLYDSTYHSELDWWTAPFDVTDGIPRASLVSAAESDRVDIGRSFPVTQNSDRRPQVPEDLAKVVVISAPEDTPRDSLVCGEALSAVLLNATMAGLATCTLTHMIEVPAAREIVGVLAGQALPQVLVRVGAAPAAEAHPPTPRRSLTEVLEWELRT